MNLIQELGGLLNEDFLPHPYSASLPEVGKLLAAKARRLKDEGQYDTDEKALAAVLMMATRAAEESLQAKREMEKVKR